MKVLIKKYMGFLMAVAAVGIIMVLSTKTGLKALGIMAGTFKEMLMLLPPVFVMLGLLDVWVPRETMVKYMGEGSGIKGIVLSILIGSAAAGPLYGAFPVAAVFMKKGAKFSNILIFLGAWSTTKIPTLMFEIASLGPAFALTRLAINIPGIIIIAHLLIKLMPKKEIERIRENSYEIL